MTQPVVDTPRSRAAVYALIGIITGLELFAGWATDPDFFLPDAFRPLIIFLLVAFVIVDRFKSPAVRTPAILILFAVPLLVLIIEWRAAARDARMGEAHMIRVSDPVLRFHYRPGYSVHGTAPSPKITEDGLWDEPHAIAKPKNTLRIVVLGDSVPNDPSIPFAERFWKRMEAKLRTQFPERAIEVINVSCEGYNTVQEVRLLERVGLKYQPDLVVLAYVLNDPFLQDGAYRRVGNSYFLFQLGPIMKLATGNTTCPLFARMHRGYAFELAVRNSLTRLHILAQLHHFDVIVATLPVLERFDDPACLGVYDMVLGIAREEGFGTTRVVDAFAGESHTAYLKPWDKHDITHPNSAGHERMAQKLADAIAPRVAAQKIE